MQALVLALALTGSVGGPMGGRAPGVPCAHAGHPQAQELVLVFPTQAGKNQVRWWEFDWHYTDFEPVEGAAPVRLYFYQDRIVPWAKGFTEEVYRDYVEAFDYRPSRMVPYLLYNSHFEFQSTTAFFISERVLGVTDVRELTMALPYWGDHARFRHILRHEMAHQFTIQMIVDTAAARGVPNPLQLVPLWYVEGVAEFFSQDRLTPEVRAVLVDRVREKPDDERLGLPGFFDQGPLSFERVYLIGHAQTRFLEEEFGEGTNRRIHEATAEMTRGARQTFGGFGAPRVQPFSAVVAGVTQTEPEEIERRWLSWVRAITDPAIEEEAARPPMREVEALGRGEIDSFSLSPDGRTMLYRTFDPQTGRTRLFVEDIRDPTSRVLVDQDQQLGLDTLHGLDRRVTALDDQMLVYIGRSADTDDLFVRRYTRQTRGDRVRFNISRARRHDFSSEHPIIEAGYPAIDPTSGSVSFTGLNRETGVIDVYRIETPLERHAPIEQLTDTPDTKRDVAYTREGTLIVSADATPDRDFELFRVLPDGRLAAITNFEEVSNARHPSAYGANGLVFTSDATGFSQAYRLVGGRVSRLTSAATYFAEPAITADGDLLGLTLVDQKRRLVRIPREEWVEAPVEAVPEAPLRARPLPRGEPSPVEEYRPLRLSNFSLANAQAFLAGGQFASGLVVFDDIFRSHLIGASFQYIGGLDWTDARIFYVNREGRWTWGMSGLVDTGLQIQTDNPAALDTFLLQRIGGAFQLQYPISRQMRVEGFVSPQALRAFSFTAPGAPFAQANEGTFPAVQSGLRFALDTTRFIAPLGPFDGTSLILDVEGTGVFASQSSFGRVGLSIDSYRPLTYALRRLYLYGRLAVGATLGGALGEQFLLPAAYNHRGFRPDAFLELVGRHYYLATGELRVPLDFALPFLPFVEGLAGVDVGAIGFELDDMLPDRRAAAVLGVNFGIGPGFSLRLHFARPFEIGGAAVPKRWITHFSLSSPLFF